MTPQEEYKADLLKVWAWLRAHPHAVLCFFWFLIGLGLGVAL